MYKTTNHDTMLVASSGKFYNSKHCCCFQNVRQNNCLLIWLINCSL